jgi:hypothetical protein
MRLLTALLIAFGVTVGCDGSPAYEARVLEAKRIAGDYLSAAGGTAEDRGWSLLHPDRRRAFASEAAYRELAERSDWSRFAWSLEVPFCDDGVLCPVNLLLPNGASSIPAVLSVDPVDSHLGPIIRTNGFPDGQAGMEVDFDRIPFGAHGVR